MRIPGNLLFQDNVGNPVGGSNLPQQNFLINSNFDIWQRGTSVNIVNATFQYCADRWFDYHNAGTGGSLPILVRSRQSLSPGEIPNSFYYTNLYTSGPGTVGSDGRGSLDQRIEFGTRMLCGTNKKVTVSFYAKSDIPNKKLGICLEQYYGTGGSPSPSEIINGRYFVLTSNWVRYSHTFTTNTLVGKTFGTDNNDFLGLKFYYMWDTTWATYVGDTVVETYRPGSTGNNIMIAQVVLNAGDTAATFIPRSFGEELTLCYRYYERGYCGVTSSKIIAATTAPFTLSYKIPKRLSNPTVSLLSYTGGNKIGVGPITWGTSITAIVSSTEYGITGEITCDGTNTGAYNGSWNYAVDAEL